MLKCFGILLAGLVAIGPGLRRRRARARGEREEGKSYFLVDPPQQTATGDKVEVLEVFSYACRTARTFSRTRISSKQSLPSGAVFTYMPAVFNATWEPYARAYYTAESLGVIAETHQALFDALHRDQCRCARSTISRRSMRSTASTRRSSSRRRTPSRSNRSCSARCRW